MIGWRNPLTTSSIAEQQNEFITTVMEKFKNSNTFQEGEITAVTKLGNIFAAKSMTTATTSIKQSWYDFAKFVIFVWSGGNQNILLAKGNLFIY